MGAVQAETFLHEGKLQYDALQRKRVYFQCNLDIQGVEDVVIDDEKLGNGDPKTTLLW